MGREQAAARLVVNAINAAWPEFRADVAGVILQVETFRALLAGEIVDAFETLFTMEISAVVALVFAHFEILGLAFLLAEGHKSWNEKDPRNHRRHHGQSQ